MRLTKIAGSSVARMMTMLGDPILAQRAYELGLLFSIHAQEELPEAAQKLTAKLAKPRHSLLRN
ncbi:enoyl-CoA hydratase/carnithine racemase [Bradyrhizobium sp. USDA 3315]